MREIRHFGQEATMAGYSGQAKLRSTSKGLTRHVGAASYWSTRVSKGDAARSHRPGAGVFQRTRREGASDLETDRAGTERLRADADAHYHLCGLPAARRPLRAGRGRYR